MIKDTLGFVGTGNIGEPMALALLAAGCPLKAYDSNPARLTGVAGSGATIVSKLADLADCSVVFVAVPDDTAVSDVVEGALTAVLSSGSAVVVHSTVLPSTARRLAEACAAGGICYVEAPVSGGADRALRGDLSVMVGGEPSAIDRVEPYLSIVARGIFRFGPAGTASVAKLANQLMMFAALAGAQEALALADAYEVDHDTLLDAVADSTGASWVASNWGFFDEVAREYDRTGVPLAFRPWSKDLWDVLVAAREVGQTLPVAALLAQLLPHDVPQRRDPL